VTVTRLNAAVVGVGRMGERHAQVYGEHPLTDLRAVVDVDGERAREVARAHGAGRVATDPEGALDDVDVVSVATPQDHHLASTRAALDAGCHVLLEKPIAGSTDDGERIVDLAAAAETELAVGYLCRFHPRYAAVRAAVDDGEFGDLLAVQAARIGAGGSYDALADRAGTTHYLAVHDVDAMRWITGAEVERVSAEASAGVGDVDEPAVYHATLRFDDGTIGVLEANWGGHESFPAGRTDELRVTGTDGYVRLLGDAPGDESVRVADGDGFRYADQSHVHGERRDFLRTQIDHVLECVRAGESPMVTPEDGLRSLRVACAIRESAREGCPVEVEYYDRF